jgi:Ca2+-binding RTX toxin-like protein
VVLIGGPNDTLIAGNKSDTFVFGPTNFGVNTIKNFNVHNDKIQIDASLFANFAFLGDQLPEVGGPGTDITIHKLDVGFS